MNKLAPILLGAVIAAPLVSAADAPQWPSGVSKKDDPQLLAFYKAQCAQYADQNGFSGEKRDAYLAKCQEDMPAIFPVGYASGGGGGGE